MTRSPSASTSGRRRSRPRASTSSAATCSRRAASRRRRARAPTPCWPTAARWRASWPTARSPVGLAVCELVGPHGRVRSAETVDWRDADLLGTFDGVESDVRAAALAEARFGAGRDEPDFLYVSVGTGISHCLMTDGAPRLGVRGSAIGTGAPLVERWSGGLALARRTGPRVRRGGARRSGRGGDRRGRRAPARPRARRARQRARPGRGDRRRRPRPARRLPRARRGRIATSRQDDGYSSADEGIGDDRISDAGAVAGAAEDDAGDAAVAPITGARRSRPRRSRRGDHRRGLAHDCVGSRIAELASIRRRAETRWTTVVPPRRTTR